MTTKHQVLAYFAAHPDSTSGQIASALGCGDAYVRKTLERNGMKARRVRKGERRRLSLSPKLQERERCAQLAERMGALLLAAAIREGVTP